MTAVDGLWGSVVVALVLSDLGSEEKREGRKTGERVSGGEGREEEE